MKKLIALLLALVMVFALVACGGSDTSTDAPAEDTTVETLTEPAKGGCGSAVTFGLAAILVSAAAWVIRKKD